MNKYKKLASNTLIFAIGSFGSKILLLLLTRLYTGNINPGDNSTKELLEQTANFLIPIITFSIADAVIRYGIDRNYDNRKVFTSACAAEASRIIFSLSAAFFLFKIVSVTIDNKKYSITIKLSINSITIASPRYKRSVYTVKAYSDI